jgi:hypothetical protein
MGLIRIIGVFTLFFALTMGSVRSAEPPVSGYDALIQQGKSQLQAGSAEQATASGKAAIKMSTERWEGYALVGGALMNLKRYEAAADTLSEAIKRAPEAKQAALRDLRRQCLLAESGSPALANTPAPATTTSQAEIVLWKSIENSAKPSDFQAYLNKYPNGAFVPLAQPRLVEAQSRLERETQEANTRAEQERQTLIGLYAWIDSSTGLMWQKFYDELFEDGKYRTFTDEDPRDPKTFSEVRHSAQRFCASLRVIGYSDWRLPTAEELLNVIHPDSKGKLNLDDNITSHHYVVDTFWTTSPGEKEGEHIVITSHGKRTSGIDRQGGALAMCVRSARDGLGAP